MTLFYLQVIKSYIILETMYYKVQELIFRTNATLVSTGIIPPQKTHVVCSNHIVKNIHSQKWVLIYQLDKVIHIAQNYNDFCNESLSN